MRKPEESLEQSSQGQSQGKKRRRVSGKKSKEGEGGEGKEGNEEEEEDKVAEYMAKVKMEEEREYGVGARGVGEKRIRKVLGEAVGRIGFEQWVEERAGKGRMAAFKVKVSLCKTLSEGRLRI